VVAAGGGQDKPSAHIWGEGGGGGGWCWVRQGPSSCLGRQRVVVGGSGRDEAPPCIWGNGGVVVAGDG
jgi:hypothetical protein